MLDNLITGFWFFFTRIFPAVVRDITTEEGQTDAKFQALKR
jgi:hypothetical protein